MFLSKPGLISLLLLAVFSPRAGAEDAAAGVETSVLSPSPDGKLAFLKTKDADHATVDLIEKASGKTLLRVAESDDDSNELDTEVLWAADSKKFAITMVYHNRRMNDLGVFSGAGGTFHEVDLPDLPEANVPEKYAKDNNHFWHLNESDWKTPVRWTKGGSLVVEIESMIDGDDNTAAATRTVVLGFDRAGGASILKSTLKVEVHLAPED